MWGDEGGVDGGRSGEMEGWRTRTRTLRDGGRESTRKVYVIFVFLFFASC